MRSIFFDSSLLSTSPELSNIRGYRGVNYIPDSKFKDGAVASLKAIQKVKSPKQTQKRKASKQSKNIWSKSLSHKIDMALKRYWKVNSVIELLVETPWHIPKISAIRKAFTSRLGFQLMFLNLQLLHAGNHNNLFQETKIELSLLLWSQHGSTKTRYMGCLALAPAAGGFFCIFSTRCT